MTVRPGFTGRPIRIRGIFAALAVLVFGVALNTRHGRLAARLARLIG